MNRTNEGRRASGSVDRPGGSARPDSGILDNCAVDGLNAEVDMKNSNGNVEMVPILTGVGLAGVVLIVIAITGIVTMLL